MTARITFVLPYYNEERFIAATLASLAGQSDRRFALRLVNNRSTDGGEAAARAAAEAMPDINIEFLREDRPGKIFALQNGAEGIATDLVGTLDADTVYPPDYVSRVISQFGMDQDLACFMALKENREETGTCNPGKWLQVLLWPRHCHSGGYGQAFRRTALEQAGGFDPARWPFVLEDHEIAHSVQRFGSLGYRRDHVLVTSDRRGEQRSPGWSPIERLAYKLLPGHLGLWFFHRILAPRFARRGLGNAALRSGVWRTGAQTPE